MERLLKKMEDELEDFSVYRVAVLVQRYPEFFSHISNRTITQWCSDQIISGAFKMGSEESNWVIFGRDFKSYIKTKYQTYA